MIKRFVVPWLTVVAIVVLLEVLAQQFMLFSHPSLGYDKILHFLAGSACGIFGAGIVAHSSCEARRGCMWFSVIFWTLAIGGGWEILQAYVPAMRDASDYDWYDTVGDLIFDLLGGIVAGIAYREKS